MKISVLILAFKILFSTPHGTWYGNRGRSGCNGPGSLGGHGPRLFCHNSTVVKCYHWFANYKTDVIIGLQTTKPMLSLLLQFLQP